MMNNLKAILNNEKGFILVLSMVTMVALTIIGISGSTNTTVEIQVAGNERHYNQAFYASEAAWQHGVQAIEIMTNPPAFINPYDSSVAEDDQDNTVDQVTTQLLDAGEPNVSYDYSTVMIASSRAPGYSGTSGYVRFWYTSTGNGTGPRNSNHSSAAVVTKVFDTSY